MPTLLKPPHYAPVRICSGRGGYEAVPESPAHLDLARVARTLASSGLAVTDARVMLIVAMDPEVTLSRDGRVLVKTSDPAVAAHAVDELWRRIQAGTSRSR